MRLVLVGPAGATVMDAWITPDRWRLAFPTRVVRGDRNTAVPQGSPLDFFRWWFLAPLDGRVLYARTERDHDVYVLRNDDATVVLRWGRSLAAQRRIGTRSESVVVDAPDFIPRVAGRAVYEGFLRVEVLVERVHEEEPDPEAFEDPDQ
jgi:hypothetical protein